ncbi:Uncharacterised protein family protein [Granulicella rosea]|uniref:Uncharacterized protein YtcA n=1 Tax=Granulicella rosea TaxID=474952 RepID=A0A239MMT9_9BACT|nr:YtcA family lipoprotein [Granulicella rosea]SNT44056.1 Uncharacterised protein family protein [Granulicella rosea]
MNRLRTRHLLQGAACLALTGCGHASNIDIIGSFFPVWMLCVAIAVPLTFIVHKLLVRFDLENDVGPLALFYPCTVLLFTSLLWLIFFR